ncbi:MAG: hypothetical protein ACTSSE_16125 [Candidatus Thorarchaeota archaeon]
MEGLIDRNKTSLTMMTTEMMLEIAKSQDEIVMNKLQAYCDDCLTLFSIRELYLEEPPLDVMSMYKKQGDHVVFQVRQQCVKLICQDCREALQ